MAFLPEGEIILSGTGIHGKGSLSHAYQGVKLHFFEMDIDIKEADARLILHYCTYHHSKKPIVELPPTSNITKDQIPFYCMYIQHHCMTGKQLLDPVDLGDSQERDFSFRLRLLSGKYATTKCICRSAGIAYCYCQCKAQGIKGSKIEMLYPTYQCNCKLHNHKIVS